MPFYIAGFSPELLAICVLVIVLLFGGKKIPELMRGVGRGMGELQKGLAEGKQHMQDAMHEEPKPTTTPAEDSQPRPAASVTSTEPAAASTPEKLD